MSLRNVFDRLARRGIELRPALHAIRNWLAPAHGPAAGLVSIILPTRNRAATIGRAIESVVAQQYANWELIILDDGSTDHTREIVRPFVAHRRIRYYRRQAAGVAAARNAGLCSARGEFVAYLDSDNDWDAGFLAGIITAFANDDVHSAYGMLLRLEGDRDPSILFDAFDRARLLEANYIDLNVFVHRRALFLAYGGFDNELKRLSDWDLILRYTASSPALAVAIAGANYRCNGGNRITDTEWFYIPYRKIRAKWRQPVVTARPLRVLYALWQYPQLSEMYIETEILAMLAFGVQVEIWSQVVPTAPYETKLKVHRGLLADAISVSKPDIVHIHWLNIADKLAEILQPLGIPVTVRGHGFDVEPGMIDVLLAHPAIHRIYLYPHQITAAAGAHIKTRPVSNAFNKALFKPGAAKNQHLVVRASAALPAKDLRFFLELAIRFPVHRFILCIVSCSLMESYVDELRAMRRELGSPAEIRLNVPHQEIALLMGEAGIYLHTVATPDQPPGTPLGAPGSIAEAMASGCYIMVRNLPALTAYVADAGGAYNDANDAARLITETMAWDEGAWRAAARRSVERAWTYFTGDDDFPALYRDWVELAG